MNAKSSKSDVHLLFSLSTLPTWFTLPSTALNKDVLNVNVLCLLLQVFATYPNEDYDRRNEDVDPMAASAEYELEKRVERLDLFPVELEKGTEHREVHLKKPRVFC